MTSPHDPGPPPKPLSNTDEATRIGAIDPDGVLRDLAFGIGSDEAPDDTVLKRARFFLKREGALAYAYHLVDDAVSIALAAGASIDGAEHYAASPLAQLIDDMIEDEFEEVPVDVLPLEPHPASKPESLVTSGNTSPSAANDDDESGPRAKILRFATPLGMALAAAAALFVFIRDPNIDSPGVKGIVSTSMTASVVTVDGPLDEAAMIRGLTTVANALGTCFGAVSAKTPMAIDISVTATGDGKPIAIVVSGTDAQDPQTSACFTDALSRASFDFAREQTRAKMRLTYVPPAQTP